MDELHIQQNNMIRQSFALHLSHERLHTFICDFTQWLAYMRQRRRTQAADLNSIVSNDRKSIRDPNSLHMQHFHCIDCNQIRGE